MAGSCIARCSARSAGASAGPRQKSRPGQPYEDRRAVFIGGFHRPHLGQFPAFAPALALRGSDYAGDNDIGVHGLMNEAPGSGLVLVARWPDRRGRGRGFSSCGRWSSTSRHPNRTGRKGRPRIRFRRRGHLDSRPSQKRATEAASKPVRAAPATALFLRPADMVWSLRLTRSGSRLCVAAFGIMRAIRSVLPPRDHSVACAAASR
jgi:hypothetical protein